MELKNCLERSRKKRVQITLRMKKGNYKCYIYQEGSKKGNNEGLCPKYSKTKIKL